MSASIKYGEQPAYAIIRERGLKVFGLAGELGVKPGHLYQSLQGRISPSAQLREKLVQKLERPLEELFTEDSLTGAQRDSFASRAFSEWLNTPSAAKKFSEMLPTSRILADAFGNPLHSAFGSPLRDLSTQLFGRGLREVTSRAQDAADSTREIPTELEEVDVIAAAIRDGLYEVADAIRSLKITGE